MGRGNAKLIEMQRISRLQVHPAIKSQLLPISLALALSLSLSLCTWHLICHILLLNTSYHVLLSIKYLSLLLSTFLWCKKSHPELPVSSADVIRHEHDGLVPVSSKLTMWSSDKCLMSRRCLIVSFFFLFPDLLCFLLMITLVQAV